MSTAQAVLGIQGLQLRRSASFNLLTSQLQLKAGQITCLTGANGSGKTTLMEIITGLILPDSGRVLVDGQDPFRQPVAAKKLIGFIPDDDGWIVAELTADELFRLLASIYKKAGVKHDVYAESRRLAERLLFSSFDQPVGELSHGNRKKVQIISALAHRPALLVVDELRNGLDPVVIKRAEELLSEAREGGAAILVATHDLWWAERLADEVVIIRNGRLVWRGSVAHIKDGGGSLEAKFMELYET